MERLTQRYDVTPDGESDVWVKQHDYISAARKLCDYEDLEEQGLHAYNIDKSIITKSINYYGEEIQSTVCMEECAELIQAISKMIRESDELSDDDYDHLYEEIADVLICVEMLKQIYCIEDLHINNWIKRKQERLLNIYNGGADMNNKTCKTCVENDNGLCDRKGILIEEDDTCEKHTANREETMKSMW